MESFMNDLQSKYAQIYSDVAKTYAKMQPISLSLLEKRYYEDDQMILFYHSDSFMSNFSPHAIPISCLWPNDDRLAMCSEMLFQCLKYFKDNPEYSLRIVTATTAKEAATLGRDRSISGFDQNWPKYNFLWMIEVLLIKLQHNPELKDKLLATEDKILVENTARGAHIDNIWGAGQEGIGENKLGICWMVVRQLIK